MKSSRNTTNTRAGIFTLFALLALFSSSAAFADHHVDHPDLARYRSLNAAEKRYTEYRDTDAMLNLKLHHLDYINASRRRYGAPPVELDILASRVANRMAQEAAEAGFRGHWNMRGEKPYHRYAFAGGTDHVAENAAASWTSGSFSNDLGSIASMMRSSHDQFMAETAPNDGHKVNCINPIHNFVGLGVAVTQNEFRYYEEFIDRYADYGGFKRSVSRGAPVSIPVRPKDGLHLFASVVFQEPLPTPLTAEAINRRGSYQDFTANQVAAIWPWQLPDANSEGFVEITYAFDGPGLYYVQIYLSDTPYRGGSASTQGKIQASGIVIRVE